MESSKKGVKVGRAGTVLTGEDEAGMCSGYDR